jgi:glycosyltransferase involved in cell wall biosynthesis
MKILMVSMFSNHFFNWTAQLKNAGHEIYWIDVFDSNTQVEKIDFVHQIVGWRNRIKYPGRYRIKNNFPAINSFINQFNQRDFSDFFENKLKEINPDVVHSFVMYSACVPIVNVMRKYPDIKWIYSAWGNDLFYYQNEKEKLNGIKETLPHIDYMFADCLRDINIAKRYGFNGQSLGVFPTGGGYDFKIYNPFFVDQTERKIILIKGYEHKFGRAGVVIESLMQLDKKLTDYRLVVFGAHKNLINNPSYYEFFKLANVTVKENLPHQEVLKLMGKSLIYIGNSISDGMPNTLLEAIIMGAFPIQSNPGGATSEIIENRKNGILIQDPIDSGEIAALILELVENTELLQEGVRFNSEVIKPRLERNYVQKEVLKKYKLVEQSLKL